LSRKSISIYLYTKTRPTEEIAPLHGTFYVQRPLPERLRAGVTLSAEDIAELSDLLARRDMWVERYQKQELEKNRELDEKNRGIRSMMEGHHAEIENAKAALAAMENEQQRQRSHQEALQNRIEELTQRNESLAEQISAVAQSVDFQRRHIRLPIVGYAVQTEGAIGVHSDLWMDPHAEFEIRPLVRVNGLRLQGWRPEGSPEGVLRMSVGEAKAEARVAGGAFTLDLSLARQYREPFRVTIACDALPRMGDDMREPGFRLLELRTLHPFFALLAKIV
jgi:hypothetical protein